MMNTDCIHKIHVGIFETTINVISATWVSAKKLLKGELSSSDYDYIEETEATNIYDSDGIFVLLPSGDGVIWVNKYVSPERLITIASHEATHATVGILDRMGIELKGESEEIYAYTNGYITANLLELLGLTPSPENIRKNEVKSRTPDTPRALYSEYLSDEIRQMLRAPPPIDQLEKPAEASQTINV